MQLILNFFSFLTVYSLIPSALHTKLKMLMCNDIKVIGQHLGKKSSFTFCLVRLDD